MILSFQQVFTILKCKSKKGLDMFTYDQKKKIRKINHRFWHTIQTASEVLFAYSHEPVYGSVWCCESSHSGLSSGAWGGLHGLLLEDGLSHRAPAWGFLAAPHNWAKWQKPTKNILLKKISNLTWIFWSLCLQQFDIFSVTDTCGDRNGKYVNLLGKTHEINPIIYMPATVWRFFNTKCIQWQEIKVMWICYNFLIKTSEITSRELIFGGF